MSKVQFMRYTKDSGDSSERKVIVVSRPRKNYLMYDVSGISEEALDTLLDAMNMNEEYQENCMLDFETLTGVKQSSLWRSFKPEGVEWMTEDDEV